MTSTTPHMQRPHREFVLEHGYESGRVLRVPTTLKGGRYKILDILANGGMGVLYRARDLRACGNIVLIKSVKYDPAAFGFDRNAALYHVYAMRQRFKREKNLLVEMSDRGLNAIPTCTDFFTDQNPELAQEFPFGMFEDHETLTIGQTEIAVELQSEPYIVMERIFGESVLDRMDDVSEARLLEIAVSVCRILERIHETRERDDATTLSFLYMDLKPDNLIVDRQGCVTLVDFGAVVPVVNGQRRGRGAFTPGFAAPELRRIAHPTARVDHRADLYSLGAILYQGLSHDRLDPTILSSEQDDEFPVLFLDDLREDIHPETRSVVEKALARDPKDRFVSAQEMRQAIELALRVV